MRKAQRDQGVRRTLDEEEGEGKDQEGSVVLGDKG